MANLLTVFRILLIAPFVYFFMENAKWNMNAALFVFILASATDFFDGWVARSRNEITALGIVLDPIADKLIIVTALFLLVANGSIASAHVTPALIIVLREILVSGLRGAVPAEITKLAVLPLAKWKTFAQMIAVGVLIAASPNGIIGQPAQIYGVGILWIAALLSVVTGGFYLRQVLGILRR
ncbi:MAG: CDP-diacylglycerol--glycerol-3-phosphate 3-phosphatidyltransferase [Marinicaulis sp.]|nr:CDP-diacylglycerol--glycerol-3-phosphate 3-phosphatidyltransferase [Marinicaulis sp.]NNL89444.1 CDP-diacylglycerol--glycerol-3-phosphate 3-phosphatidyltransferase [Marinicaulis sp.]